MMVTLSSTGDAMAVISITVASGISREGAGINGMRERALLVNATLAIASPEGEGTEVRLAIPLRSM